MAAVVVRRTDSGFVLQVVDFYHATQYLWKAADPLFPEDATGLRPWIDTWCVAIDSNTTPARPRR